MPYAALKDADLHYDISGEQGSPVLLIMGFGAPGRFWRPQAAAISPQHRVAWFDNAGSGNTRLHRLRPLTMRVLRDHTIGLLDALGWPDAHIVGVSMGGMIAQELALAQPERVRSLSLIVSHAGGVRSVVPTARGISLFMRGFIGPRRGRIRALEELIFPADYLASEEMERARERMRKSLGDDVAEGTPLSARLAQMGAVFSHNTANRLHQLAGISTLVIGAGQDVLVRPSGCRRLSTLIPGAELMEFEDAGHGVLFQHSARINDALLAHFGRADQARADLTQPRPGVYAAP